MTKKRGTSAPVEIYPPAGVIFSGENVEGRRRIMQARARLRRRQGRP